MPTEHDSKIIDDAWLGLSFEEENLYNPMSIVDFNDPEFKFNITWLLSQPEYFSIICKHVLNIDMFPTQALIMRELWERKFPMLIASRGYGKSFTLSLYAILRALLMPKRKIVIVGAAFRQSKHLFEYMETIWKNAPMLRDICSASSGPRRATDRYVMQINDSTITCLPLGDGSKIRGQRANDIIADEFASIPRDIFENVVVGFAAVSSNPIKNMKKIAANKMRKKLGYEIITEQQKEMGIADNQLIVSGTAYYDFNHFADYWKKWRAIINSAGGGAEMRALFGEQEPPKSFNWKDYSVIRIPYELIPEGFMDDAQVSRSRASTHTGIYQMEYGAVFTTDSQGFFKRTLIESCVANGENDQLVDKNGRPLVFNAALRGNPKKKYIFGVDPASEVDNFSIIVLEINENERRIVHCWTTNRSEHKDKVKKGFTTEKDFYSYCARKIRDLMKVFPCEHIALDAQGGGIAVMEALHDDDKIEEGELPIWPIVEPGNEQDTDFQRGLHILEMCQFADYKWLSAANHGLRKDFEDKVVLFPQFDSIELGISEGDDEMARMIFDTKEDCILDIEKLKDELAMIQVTQTNAGRDKWDTPEVIVGTGRKEKMRKDRYSALIMANMAARTGERAIVHEYMPSFGGFAGLDMPDYWSEDNDDNKEDGPMFVGPPHLVDQISTIY